MTGATESSLAKKIHAELTARGFVVESGSWTDVDIRLNIDADGSVTIEGTGAPAESLVRERDDDIFSQKVAESVRARVLTPTDAPSSAEHATAGESTAPVTVRQPPARPAPTAASTIAATSDPSRRFAEEGSLMISADDALPLASVGTTAPLAMTYAFRIGDPGGLDAPVPPRPVFIDYAVLDKLTLGVAPILEDTVAASSGARSIHFIGGAIRAGYLAPLGKHTVLWPRVSVLHLRGPVELARLDHRTELSADLRIGWTPTGSWMLTLGPSITIPIEAGSPKQLDWVEPSDPATSTGTLTFPIPSGVRFALAAGLTVKLDDDRSGDDIAPVSKPSFLLGVERLVPLVRFRVEGGDRTALDVGTADTTSQFPAMPRIAFDALLGKKLTLGAAASAGYVRTSRVDFVPTKESGALVLAVAPRVGALLPISKAIAFWPRAGVTWVHSPQYEMSTDATGGPALNPEHRLGLDVDAFAVAMPVAGVGIVVGPSLALPLAETSSLGNDSFLSVGISAGLVLLL